MTKTPGQIAYEAQRASKAIDNPGFLQSMKWHQLDDWDRSHWESAAQAVRAPLLEELNALRIAFADASHDAGPAFIAHEAFDAARVEIAGLREQVAVLTSQVEHCDVNVAQAKMNAESKFREEIAALRKSNAELVKSANEIFLVDPSANVPRFFAAVRELKSAITLATEPKP